LLAHRHRADELFRAELLGFAHLRLAISAGTS
jgi:hypothetical protein